MKINSGYPVSMPRLETATIKQNAKQKFQLIDREKKEF
jgi:hypothetical protein